VLDADETTVLFDFHDPTGAANPEVATSARVRARSIVRQRLEDAAVLGAADLPTGESLIPEVVYRKYHRLFGASSFLVEGLILP
jgi:hypothetical protein